MSEPVEYLSKLFEDHGLTCVVQEDWILPNAEPPALRGLWYPAQSSGQLDIQVLVHDNVIIGESFAGFGEGESGLQDALVNFTANSLHVLLAALWGKNDPEQVTTEPWLINGRHYTAYVGNFGTRASAGVMPDVPTNLFALIEEAIKSETLTDDIHWFRLFFCNVANEFTFEALKDNNIWEKGITCLESVPLRRDDGYYSVRLFLVLRSA